MNNYRERLFARYATGFQGRNLTFDQAAAERWGRPYRHYLRGWLPDSKTASIVDLACGGGALLHHFKQLGYANIAGVEISPEQVKLARQVTPQVHEQNVLEYLVARRAEIDLLTSLDLVEHLTKDEVLAFLDRCREALRPGGRLILQTPNAVSPWCGAIRHGDFTHEVCFTPALLSRLLQMAGFRNIEAREQGPVAVGCGFKQSLRYLLWRCVSAAIGFCSLVETGSTGERVRTRVFVISAVK